MSDARPAPEIAPTKGLTLHDRVRGCILGGAVGDALGAPIEFMNLAQIRKSFGKNGLTEYAAVYGQPGMITDDTQMTLFTAEGLIRARVRAEHKGICHPPTIVHHAYLRWLITQGEHSPANEKLGKPDGWLIDVPALHNRRAPGNTCIAALKASDSMGSPEKARNDSKGCGGVMRVAPVGLFAQIVGDDAEVFELAASLAAYTHGHPSGFLSAGYFAVVIAALARGCAMQDALDIADVHLARKPDAEECVAAILAARNLAAAGRPSPEMIERLGGGWVAEEALAIAICCALVAQDFKDGIVLAANHSGDSDSTAAMTGNLLGTALGIGAIPTRLLEGLEIREEIERLSCDLARTVEGRTPSFDIYPGW